MGFVKILVTVVVMSVIASSPAEGRGLGTNVSIYGPPGTFGALGSATTTSSGDSLSVASHPYAFSPGKSAWFPVTTSDGMLFVAAFTQGGNVFYEAGCTLEIMCFHHSFPGCRDPQTGLPTNVALFKVPSLLGPLYVPDEACDGDLAGGASVPDLAVVGTGANERVVFNADASETWPVWGSLHKANGAWQLDETSLRTPLELSDSNPPISRELCPLQRKTCCDDAECGGGTCEGVCFYPLQGECETSCTSDADCSALGAAYGCRDGSCVTAWCRGENELAVLPASGRVVMTHYFSAISVTDGDDEILAKYELPDVPNPCTTGTVHVAPRGVFSDPTGTLGNERFVVAYDTGDPTGQPLQEFRYDETTRTIEPLTSPFFANVPWGVVPGCSSVRLGSAGRYDERGNLWATHGIGIPYQFPTSTVLYFKNPLTGKTSAQERCPASGSWGTVCPGDVGIGYWNGNSSTPYFSYDWSQGNEFDAEDNTYFVATVFPGSVVPIRRIDTGGSKSYLAIVPPVKLDYPELQLLADQGGAHTTQVVLHEDSGNLWIPVRSGCTDGCGATTPGSAVNSWVYRVRIDPVLAQRPAILAVFSTLTRVNSSNLRLKVTIETNLTSLPSSPPMPNRIFVYKDNDPTPQKKDMVRSSSAQGYVFKVDFTFPASTSVTRVQWDAVLTDSLSAVFDKPVVVAGSETPP